MEDHCCSQYAIYSAYPSSYQLAAHLPTAPVVSRKTGLIRRVRVNKQKFKLTAKSRKTIGQKLENWKLLWMAEADRKVKVMEHLSLFLISYTNGLKSSWGTAEATSSV